MGTQFSASMLGSAVSSNTPRDFQPNSHMGVLDCPVMNRQAGPGSAMGCPYAAVGMTRAVDSAIGFPSRSTSASRMLVFLMPAEVRRSFMRPPGVVPEDQCSSAYVRGRDWQGTGNSSPLARSDLTFSGTFANAGPAQRSPVHFHQIAT